MGIRTSLAALVLLSLGATSHASDPVGTTDTQLTVRVYGGRNAGSLRPETGYEVAARLLRHAGIEAHWVFCPEPGSDEAHDPCAVPLEPTELAVRVTRSNEPTTGTTQLPLGYSLVDAARGAGSLATVYVDRVEWLARAAGTPRHDLFGRAIAHEIGHLLLGTNEHATSGVMRGQWSSDSLRSSAQDWEFTREHGTRMRAALRTRGAQMVAVQMP